jgi:hypothetical protein
MEFISDGKPVQRSTCADVLNPNRQVWPLQSLLGRRGGRPHETIFKIPVGRATAPASTVALSGCKPARDPTPQGQRSID